MTRTVLAFMVGVLCSLGAGGCGGGSGGSDGSGATVVLFVRETAMTSNNDIVIRRYTRQATATWTSPLVPDGELTGMKEAYGSSVVYDASSDTLLTVSGSDHIANAAIHIYDDAASTPSSSLPLAPSRRMTSISNPGGLALARLDGKQILFVSSNARNSMGAVVAVDNFDPKDPGAGVQRVIGRGTATSPSDLPSTSTMSNYSLRTSKGIGFSYSRTPERPRRPRQIT